MNSFQLNTIEEAIEEIKNGKMVIVVDDEDRENEGDFLTAARNVTTEMVNFMATEGRGLICVPLTEERCDELNLDLMVGKNTAQFETPFTVSVDLIGHGTSTGISAYDRFMTIQALVDPDTNPKDLGKPGHIFPLRARTAGVLRRAGHTEAAIDLARLAGFEPAGCIVEIMNEDGTMARLPDLIKVAEKHNMKIVSIADLIEYRLKHESLIERCDCGEQLKKAMQTIENEGKGVIVYMNQEGRGIGLLNKLKAYKLQENGMDTVEANLELGFQMDERDYGVGAQILRDLGVRKIKLMSNNPKKRKGLIGYGLEIVENVALQVEPNPHNRNYLSTKKEKMGHDL
ncbi:MAG: 3,4-dihydroxy-2-butanone-4-phosphate synthase [Bacteroidetes bacterium]|nr:3,4-dihydroxy-2-butanone-4-phosphate synthase [Bacteroidota bacterium]